MLEEVAKSFAELLREIIASHPDTRSLLRAGTKKKHRGFLSLFLVRVKNAFDFAGKKQSADSVITVVPAPPWFLGRIFNAGDAGMALQGPSCAAFRRPVLPLAVVDAG
ncbi:MAG: hypothetical protein IPN59_12210 [Holophaga sp.]|nr:hypothetical protein [Holophaga sp.]